MQLPIVHFHCLRLLWTVNCSGWVTCDYWYFMQQLVNYVIKLPNCNHRLIFQLDCFCCFVFWLSPVSQCSTNDFNCTCIAGNIHGVQFDWQTMKIKTREIKFSHAIKRGCGHRDLHAATSHQFVVVELLQECLCYAILRCLATTKPPDPQQCHRRP